MKPRRTIDEKLGLVDRVFLILLPEKSRRGTEISREGEPYLPDPVRFRTNTASIQNRSPAALITVSSSVIYSG